MCIYWKEKKLMKYRSVQRICTKILTLAISDWVVIWDLIASKIIFCNEHLPFFKKEENAILKSKKIKRGSRVGGTDTHHFGERGVLNMCIQVPDLGVWHSCEEGHS